MATAPTLGYCASSFSSREEKDILVSRFDEAKRLLVPDGNVKRSTLSVLNAMLDRVLTALLETAGMRVRKDDLLLSCVLHSCISSVLCPSCKECHVWASSRVLAGHYLANQKLALVILLLLVIKVFFFFFFLSGFVHAFTRAGMLPRQYINFCTDIWGLHSYVYCR